MVFVTGIATIPTFASYKTPFPKDFYRQEFHTAYFYLIGRIPFGVNAK